MYKVLVCDKLPESALDLFRENQSFDITVYNGIEKNELHNIVSEYHAVIVRSATKISAEVIHSARNLKVIGRAGSGLDNIDVACADEHGIAVLNTPGSNSRAVAELVIALLFTLARKLFHAMASLKAHRWEKKSLAGIELRGKTLGLIGFGKIGQQVAELAAGIGMNVMINKPSPLTRLPGFECELVSRDELLAKSDYVSLHVPKSAQTENMISMNELQKMKPSAFLINCARGGIVNEQDLHNALENGIIAGAALDVYDYEPPTDFVLVDHEKVICTPHIGAATAESQERVGQDIVKSVMEYLQQNYVFIGGEK